MASRLSRRLRSVAAERSYYFNQLKFGRTVAYPVRTKFPLKNRIRFFSPERYMDLISPRIQSHADAPALVGPDFFHKTVELGRRLVNESAS
jgi:hypothetical protein